MEIEAYEFGKIIIDGKEYTADVIILPESVRDSWWRKEGHSLHRDDLAAVVAAKPDVLIIGTGYYGRMAVPEETRAFLETSGIALHTARTGEAVQEFNHRARESARVVAALHLTC